MRKFGGSFSPRSPDPAVLRPAPTPSAGLSWDPVAVPPIGFADRDSWASQHRRLELSVNNLPRMVRAGRAIPSSAFVVLGLLAITVAARLPFLFPAAIDWDESTQILTGPT